MSAPVKITIRITSKELNYEEFELLSNKTYSLLESLLKLKVTGPEGSALVGIESRLYADNRGSYKQYEVDLTPDFTLLHEKKADHQT